MNIRKIAIAASLAAAALGSGAAHARGDVQWSVTIASPELRLPGGGVVYLPPIPLPRAVVVHPRHEVEYRDAPRREVEYRDAPRHGGGQGGGYREPRRWDVDGDGIPNRRDRVYNPRWDRDGDGVPNRYDRTPRGGHDGRDQRGWRDDRWDGQRDGHRNGRRD
jgi:hypothetical protein